MVTPAMTDLKTNRKPTFVWQGLLIMLPVVVLAAVGFFSLRQDKVLAEHEATERAQAIADDLLPKIWSELNDLKSPDDLDHHAFEIDPEGQLLSPPAITPLAPNPFDRSQLSAVQAALWRKAEAVEADDGDVRSAIQVLRGFLDSNPPPNFAATARYRLGLLLTKAARDDEAREM